MHINAKHYSFKLNQATQNTYCVFIPKRSKMLSKQHFGNVLTFPRISPTRSSMRNCERKVIGHLKILSGHVKFWNYVPDGHVLLGSKCWALCFRSLDGFGCPGLWDFSKTGFRSPAFPQKGKGSHSRAAHPRMKPDWVPLPPPPPPPPQSQCFHVLVDSSQNANLWTANWPNIKYSSLSLCHKCIIHVCLETMAWFQYGRTIAEYWIYQSGTVIRPFYIRLSRFTSSKWPCPT